MSKVERSFKLFSAYGITFLLLELLIVFVGVYGAFYLQNHSEQRKVKSEKEKVLIALKKDMEVIRVFFPRFTIDDTIEEWNTVIENNQYRDISDWRYIQPQYDYTAIEYALRSDAEVVDFELYEVLSDVYQRLQALEHTEELMTELAMRFKPIPENAKDQEQVRFLKAENYHTFKLFVARAVDRKTNLERVVQLSKEHLPSINANFSPTRLAEMELTMIKDILHPFPKAQRLAYVDTLTEFFPNLKKEDLERVLGE
ncbi:MAG: hypothetical protein AAFW89_05130 [Bacteroidota bacterium]